MYQPKKRAQPPSTSVILKHEDVGGAPKLLKFVSFNVEGMNGNLPYLTEILKNADIGFLQEHWMFDCQIKNINDCIPKCDYVAVATDTFNPIAPHNLPRGWGGTAICWSQSISHTCRVSSKLSHPRVIQKLFEFERQKTLLISVYMPCCSGQTLVVENEYMETLEHLRLVLSDCQDDTLIIMAGDFNVDPFKHKDAQKDTVKDRLCTALSEIAKEFSLSMLSTDIPTMYAHGGNNIKSTLDLVFISTSHTDNSSISIAEKVPWNTSCHVPVFFTIDVRVKHTVSKNSTTSSFYVPRKSIDPDLYNVTLGETLRSIDSNHMTPTDAVDMAIAAIKFSELQSGDIKRHKNSNRKSICLPPDTLETVKRSKKLHYLWKCEGSPGADHALSIAKRKASKSVRASLRCFDKQKREKLYRDLCEAALCDPKKFSSLLTGKKTSRGNCSIMYNGQLITDSEKGCDAWANYIEDLGKPVDSIDWDLEYLECAIESVNNIRACYKENPAGIPVTPEDVMKSILSLKTGKAADPEGICPEHLRMGAQHLSEFLAPPIHMMTKVGVPASMKHEKKIQISKKGRDPLLMKGHRSIGITSCFTKVYENITKRKEGPIPQCSQQVGFTTGLCPIFAALAMTEVICHARNTKSNLFVATIDAAQAFDHVRRDIMMFELYRKQVSPQFWSIIDDLYRDTTAHIIWNGTKSKSIKIQEGTGQGRSLAGDLFKVSIDPSLVQCVQSNIGAHIGHINMSCPTCADDVLLMSFVSLDLQRLLNLLHMSNNRSQTLINTDKCEVASRSGSHPPLFYGNDQLPHTDSPTHIGLQRNLQTPNADVLVKINTARRCLYSKIPAGIHGTNGTPPFVSRSVMMLYVIPQLLAGIEGVLPTSNDKKRISVFFNQTIKRLMAVRSCCSNAASYLLIGLMPIEAYMDTRILQLFGSVSTLRNTDPLNEVAKRQLSIPEKSKGWFTGALDVAEKYGIMEVAIQMLYGELSKAHWKRAVNRAVKSKVYTEIINTCHASSSMEFLDLTKIQYGKAHFLWPVKGDSRQRTAAAYRAKIITGTYILQSTRAKFNSQEVDPTCPLCHEGIEDTPHFLLLCTGTEVVRKKYTDTLSDVFHIELNKDNPHTSAQYLLNLGPSPQNSIYCTNKHKEKLMIEQSCVCMKVSNIVNAMILALHNTRNEILGNIQKKKKTRTRNKTKQTST